MKLSVNQKTGISNICENAKGGAIYRENIRVGLNVNATAAAEICKQAVKEGILKERLAIQCPNCGRNVKTVDVFPVNPKRITCDICKFIPDERHTMTVYFEPKVKIELKLTKKKSKERCQKLQNSNND